MAVAKVIANIFPDSDCFRKAKISTTRESRSAWPHRATPHPHPVTRFLGTQVHCPFVHALLILGTFQREFMRAI
jgi:hypothetical protein